VKERDEREWKFGLILCQRVRGGNISDVIVSSRIDHERHPSACHVLSLYIRQE
jgi:hypothetical protein